MDYSKLSKITDSVKNYHSRVGDNVTVGTKGTINDINKAFDKLQASARKSAEFYCSLKAVSETGDKSVEWVLTNQQGGEVITINFNTPKGSFTFKNDEGLYDKDFYPDYDLFTIDIQGTDKEYEILEDVQDDTSTWVVKDARTTKSVKDAKKRNHVKDSLHVLQQLLDDGISARAILKYFCDNYPDKSSEFIDYLWLPPKNTEKHLLSTSERESLNNLEELEYFLDDETLKEIVNHRGDISDSKKCKSVKDAKIKSVDELRKGLYNGNVDNGDNVVTLFKKNGTPIKVDGVDDRLTILEWGDCILAFADEDTYWDVDEDKVYDLMSSKGYNHFEQFSQNDCEFGWDLYSKVERSSLSDNSKGSKKRKPPIIRILKDAAAFLKKHPLNKTSKVSDAELPVVTNEDEYNALIENWDEEGDNEVMFDYKNHFVRLYSKVEQPADEENEAVIYHCIDIDTEDGLLADWEGLAPAPTWEEFKEEFDRVIPM